MKKYTINQDYKYKYDKVIYKVINRVLKEENVKNAVFSIVFVDDSRIREINKNYRNIDKVTDVISFALNDSDNCVDFADNILGDIYISIPKMKSQALEYEHSETRELAFLCVHGLLHLLGYDHMTKEEEIIMFAKQELVLNEFKKTKK